MAKEVIVNAKKIKTRKKIFKITKISLACLLLFLIFIFFGRTIDLNFFSRARMREQHFIFPRPSIYNRLYVCIIYKALRCP